MRSILGILPATITLGALSSATAQQLDYRATHKAKPRSVAAFSIAKQQVEMVAVTRRARADTPLRAAHLEDCENMAKVMPGYPQPAFVSVDFRIKF